MKIISLGKEPILNYESIIHYNAKESLEETIEAIVDINPDLIVLALDEKFNFSEIGEKVSGHQLLVWLRIKYISTPILALGEKKIEEYLGKQESLILGAKDIHIYCSGEKPNEKQLLVTPIEVKETNYKKYLLAYIGENNQVRHKFANIWGLRQLKIAYNECCYNENDLRFNFKLEDTFAYGLQYNVFEYYYNNKDDINNKDEIIQQARNLKYLNLKNNREINIVFIDDKAESGWLEFLQNIIDSHVQIHSLKIDKETTAEKLFSQLKRIQIKNENVNYKQQKTLKKIDFIISDLRLLNKEEDVKDYSLLESVKLMKTVYDDSSFNRTHYMLFTASNQVMNFKNAFYENKYTPTEIYVKQSFDSAFKSDYKYTSLLQLLKSLNKLCKFSINNNFRGREYTFGDLSEKESEIVNKFVEKDISKSFIEQCCNLNAQFKDYTHIIVDTNIFIDSPFFSYYNNKVVCPYPVFKELEKQSADRGAGKLQFFSKYFMDNFDRSKVSKEGLKIEQINEVNNHYLDNKIINADDYFVNIVTEFSKKPNARILLLSNDVKKDGPISRISAWINKDRITNVDAGTLYEKFKPKFQTKVSSLPISKDKVPELSEQKTDFVKQNPTIIEESTLAEKPLVDTYISFQFLKKIFYLYIKQIFNGKH